MQARFLLLTCLLSLPLHSVAGSLAGTANYRERIALPPEAQFRAQLFDISNNKQIEIGRYETTGDAGPPYRFTIDYADDAVRDGGLYAIQAEIIWRGRGYVAAGTLLEGFPALSPTVNLVMVRPQLSPAVGATNPVPEQTPQIDAHGLRLPATFAGTASVNGASQTWALSLASDQSFQLVRSFDNGSSRASLGRWQADPTRNALVLRDGAEMPLTVSRSGRTDLQVLDANTGTAYEGTLVRVDAPEELVLEGMLLSGMMTYMADSALFDECLSGTRFPVHQSGGYLELERAYLADRPAPGEPLYVTVEGDIAPRPAMEGPDRQMLVVDRFVRTRPGINCERQRASASLRNTYWRLDTLEGAAFPRQPGLVEPHLVLEAGSSLAYRAMLGCNRMRGGFTIKDSDLRFAPAASTMMACQEPLDSLERQFGQVMAAVASYAINGETLVLKDAREQTLAIFTAVYF